ncbi:hypothetical protein ITI46_11050 [Streptomyces oryzae]|uniref:PepSY domain-containing protein n=1 Tax=Streptomyces oryzae TaxID=1434886 RepID=A0ABS3X9Z0_9ACTN|nr:hypothetical protein [Streptomyces oryzae]MBO8192198.1 hypothetical protein [Streptomyces oryzae]
MPNFRSRSPRSPGTPASALLGAAALLLGAGMLTACTTSDSRLYAGPGEASSTASPTFSGPRSAAPSGLSVSVRSALKGVRAAEQAVPRGSAYHLVHDDEGEPEWEIKVAAEGGSEWSVTVSEDGGKVTDRHEDRKPDDDTGKLDTFHATLGDAVRRTAARHPGQDLHSVALRKDEKGEDIWEVTVSKGTLAGAPQTRTLINAATGRERG